MHGDLSPRGGQDEKVTTGQTKAINFFMSTHPNTTVDNLLESIQQANRADLAWAGV
jgi:hypothetical protein